MGMVTPFYVLILGISMEFILDDSVFLNDNYSLV